MFLLFFPFMVTKCLEVLVVVGLRCWFQCNTISLPAVYSSKDLNKCTKVLGQSCIEKDFTSILNLPICT